MIRNEYSPLFERTYIGKLGVKNRIVLAPMGIGGETGGAINEEGIDYYEARAKGGVGMVIPGFQLVTNKTDPMVSSYYAVDTQLQAMGWAKLVDRVKAYGTSVCVQLSCGLGRCGVPMPGMQNVSSSENTNFYDNNTTRPLTVDEIHDIVASFGRAAERAKAAGIDAIEIHAHYGYLLDQFMTSLWNKREDEYGGSFENRMRLLVEIYQIIRQTVGSDYPILMRMVMEHKIPGGREVEESLEIIRMMDKLGIDGFDIDIGCYESYDWAFPTAYRGDAAMLYAAELAKNATDKPILNTGSFTPESALKAVKDGKTDFVILARGLLADPEYANKLYYGKREDLRPCIRCDEYCLMPPGGRPQSCSVNAACAAEKEYAIIPTNSPKNVVVVGGGPGGMEAARVAALKGHKVTLYEKGGELGGQLRAAAGPAFKGQIHALMEYLKTQIHKLDVEVKLHTAIGADSPELVDADKIIVAIGADAFIPQIPGVDRSNVIEVMDLHTGSPDRIGSKVIIAGGGLSGCDCAIDLAMKGKDITIVEMLDSLVPKALFPIVMSVNDKISEYGIKARTGNKILAFTDKGAKVESKDGETEIEADTVILAIGTRSNADSAKSILDKYTNAQSIGDCVRVGQIGEAVRSGFFAGWAIE